MNQISEIKEIVEWRNDNIIEEKDATYLAFDSIEDIIDSEETRINECILENITADEKFKIICRAKDFDIDEIGEEIYRTIENSKYEDKKQYITIGAYQDESMEIDDKYLLEIDYDMLTTFDEWAKHHIDEYDISYEECQVLDWESIVLGDIFTEKQKEFIQLALDCGVNRIWLLLM